MSHMHKINTRPNAHLEVRPTQSRNLWVAAKSRPATKEMHVCARMCVYVCVCCEHLCEGHRGSLCMCERVFKFSDSCSLVHYNPTLLIPQSSRHQQKETMARTPREGQDTFHRCGKPGSYTCFVCLYATDSHSYTDYYEEDKMSLYAI